MNVELLSPQPYQQPFPQQQQGPGLADYVSVVRRRIWHVIIPFVLFTLLGLGVALLVPKEYQGITSLYLEDDYAAPIFSAVGVTIPHKQLLTTIQQDIIRVDFLNPLIEQYEIREGYNPDIPKERAKMYEKIRKRVIAKTVPQKQGPDFIEFYYEGRDAVKVTKFVNAIREKWKADFSRRYSEAALAVERNIETLAKEYLASLTEAETRLKNFQDANGPDYFGKDPGGQARSALAQLKLDVENWGFLQQADEGSLRVVTTQLDKVPALASTDTSKKASTEYTSQQAKVDTLTSQIALAKEQGYLDTWPPVKTAMALLEAEKHKLESLDKFVTESFQQSANPQWVTLMTRKAELESSIAAYKTRSDKARKRLEELEKEVGVIPEKTAQAVTLQGAVYEAEAQYTKTKRAQDTMRATKDRVMSKARSIFRTVQDQTPKEAEFADPVFPNIYLFMGIGAFIGLLLGGSWAFISEFAAVGFTTPNQVRYTLQVPVLGEVSPMVTIGEAKERKKRKLQYAVAIFVLVLIVAVIHLLYFKLDSKGKAEWQRYLPQFVQAVMKRIYGAVG